MFRSFGNFINLDGLSLYRCMLSMPRKTLKSQYFMSVFYCKESKIYQACSKCVLVCFMPCGPCQGLSNCRNANKPVF